MWPAIAEEDLKCTECYHTIPAGTDCLSQMPVPMPDGFRRRKYDNFCADCPECKAQRRRRPCYVRHLSHWYARKEKTTGSATCVYCGDAIPDGTRAVVQKFFAWPDSEFDSVTQNAATQRGGTASGVVSGVTTKPNAAAWHNLSRATQRRFMSGGLGRGLGRRSPAMAQRLYDKEVPQAIQRMGEPAVREFLKGKHFSHVKSVANAPGMAKAPGNVVLEGATANLSRSSRNMTSSAREAAKSAARSSAIRAGAKTALKGGAKAGFFAGAVEAAVSVPENILHYKRGRKSRKQAAQDIAKDTSIAAGVGVATWGVAQGATMAGFGFSLGPYGTPLMIAGGGLMAGSAIHRIYKAAKRDLPLDEYRVYFCKNANCRKKYARQVTKAVRGRSSFGGPWAITLGLAGLAIVAITAVAWLS